MREIKFKILKIDLHSFLYDEGRTILEIGIEDLGAIRHNPKNYLFIQYTGLKDKSGKEIYEGDMVKGVMLKDFARRIGYNDSSLDKIFVVQWDLTSFTWEIINSKDKRFLDGVEVREQEVIGNIYEDPELLEEE